MDKAALEAARFAYEVPDLWDKPPSVRLHAAIEAYLSALPLGKDEPVAWLLNHPMHGENLSQAPITDGDRSLGWVDTPLYVSPPSEREVIEATDAMVSRFMDAMFGEYTTPGNDQTWVSPNWMETKTKVRAAINAALRSLASGGK